MTLKPLHFHSTWCKQHLVVSQELLLVVSQELLLEERALFPRCLESVLPQPRQPIVPQPQHVQVAGQAAGDPAQGRPVAVERPGAADADPRARRGSSDGGSRGATGGAEEQEGREDCWEGRHLLAWVIRVIVVDKVEDLIMI